MTRRLFDTEDGWHVATGWDRMLQYFFLDVTRKCSTCGGDGETGDDVRYPKVCPDCHGVGELILYDNLSDTNLTMPGRGMTLKQVAEKLDELIENWPKTLIALLNADRANDRGNDVQSYGVQGRLKNAC